MSKRRVCITNPSVFIFAFQNAGTGGWIPRIEIDGLNEAVKSCYHMECDIISNREYEYFFEAIDAALHATALLGYDIYENVGIDWYLPEHKGDPEKCREYHVVSVDEFLDDLEMLQELSCGEKMLN